MYHIIKLNQLFEKVSLNLSVIQVQIDLRHLHLSRMNNIMSRWLWLHPGIIVYSGAGAR